jgi:N-terminal half of MaoC dehydratase
MRMAARRFPVEAGHVLAFARALGADDPSTYSLRTSVSPLSGLPAAGDVAPPTFAIAGAQFDPEYPLRPRPGVLWHGSGGDAGLVTEGAAGLHAEQHFVYHRPIRVGDVLSGATRPGEEWEKQGRSGQLRFREQITEYRDEAGELVITACSVSVRRDRS